MHAVKAKKASFTHLKTQSALPLPKQQIVHTQPDLEDKPGK